MSRIGTALGTNARELRRTPVLLALLVFLPAYLVGLFTVVAPDTSVAFALPGGETAHTTLTHAFPAFTTPMAAALLSAVTGLFLVQSAAVDARLVIAGYSPTEVLLARVGLLVGVSVVATAVAVGTMSLVFVPAHPGWYATAVLLAAVAYGLLGVVAGSLLDRLPGVYLVLFGTMIDLFLFQNPLATDRPDAARFLPGHYPLRLAVDAAFGTDVSAGLLGGALAAVGALTVVAVGAFYYRMRP